MRVTLKVVKGPHEGAEFQFDQYASFVVGRHRKAQFRLSLKDPKLSRFHFHVEVNPPRCAVVDLGSTNHTYLNGEEVTREFLSDGDTIKAGATHLKVSIESTPASPHSHHEDDRDGATPEVPGYVVGRKLGSGLTGTVYLATDTRDKSRVALKMISPKIANCDRSSRRFEREAVILSQLEQSHIVSLLDYGRSAGRLYIATEYIAGRDAMHLLHESGGRLPIKRAADLVWQALDALAYAHDAGVVHRDVKPENLLIANVNGRDHVKLADFGLARIYQESSLSGLTIAGDIRGTYGYMPPEQITDHRNVGPLADVYGAGGTLYALLTGRLPYEFPDDPNLCLGMIINQDPIPVQAYRREVPEELAWVVDKALARDPIERFTGARAMQRELAVWAGRG